MNPIVLYSTIYFRIVYYIICVQWSQKQFRVYNYQFNIAWTSNKRYCFFEDITFKFLPFICLTDQTTNLR